MAMSYQATFGFVLDSNTVHLPPPPSAHQDLIAADNQQQIKNLTTNVRMVREAKNKLPLQADVDELVQSFKDDYEKLFPASAKRRLEISKLSRLSWEWTDGQYVARYRYGATLNLGGHVALPPPPQGKDDYSFYVCVACRRTMEETP